MNDHATEVWLRMYEEQVRHGRHHETLRSHSTNLIVFMSAAILAFLSSSEPVSNYQSNVLGVFLIVVNAYGFLMSSKHYERNRLHIAVSKEYRNTISKHSGLNGNTINAARNEGKENHYKETLLLHNVRAHWLWKGLHVVLIFMALFLICWEN